MTSAVAQAPSCGCPPPEVVELPDGTRKQQAGCHACHSFHFPPRGQTSSQTAAFVPTPAASVKPKQRKRLWVAAKLAAFIVQEFQLGVTYEQLIEAYSRLCGMPLTRQSTPADFAAALNCLYNRLPSINAELQNLDPPYRLAPETYASKDRFLNELDESGKPKKAPQGSYARLIKILEGKASES
ncbi:MAG: hypothetical protein WC876_03075 [Candidatus Thermoplasmatota archaeon]